MHALLADRVSSEADGVSYLELGLGDGEVNVLAPVMCTFCAAGAKSGAWMRMLSTIPFAQGNRSMTESHILHQRLKRMTYPLVGIDICSDLRVGGM